MARSWILILAALCFAGCSPVGYVLPENDDSFNTIREVVRASIPRGLRLESDNGHEFFSGYFPIAGAYHDIDATKMINRAYAHVLVLGASRPYEIEVRVHIESLEDGVYVDKGYDENLQKEIGMKIQTRLDNRRGKSKSINSLRVF